MEQSLECFPDPRDFYSADSPVLGDSNQVSSGAEVQDDNQADSISAPNVRYSNTSHSPRRRLISLPQQPQVLPHQDLRAQPQPAPPIGYCTCARTLGTDHDQRGRHTNTATSPRQIGINTQGQGSSGSGGRRGRSPKHRGHEQKSLAVSSRLVRVIPVLTVSSIRNSSGWNSGLS